VNAESQLRFGPERRNLRSQKREARRTYAGDVAAADASSRGQVQAARAAVPQMRRIFQDASGAVSAGPSPDVSVSALGPAAGRDADGTRRRLGEAMAAAAQELVARQQDAVAGRALAVRSARDRRDDAIDRANEGLRGLARDSGAFRQGRTGELVETARDRQVTRRGQNITAGNNKRSNAQGERNSIRASGIDPDTGKVIRGGRLDPDGNGKRGDQSKGKGKSGKGTGPGSATQARVEAAGAALALARTQAKRLAKTYNRGEVERLLIEGRAKQSVTDPKTGDKLQVPGVQKVKATWAKVALELQFDGYVSDATRKRLNALGYSLNQLGLPRIGKPRKTYPGGGGHGGAPTADGRSSRPT
jgi:hypothetical protein